MLKALLLATAVIVPPPGALNPAVTQATISSTICVRGWTATVRPPASYTNALKRQQLAAAGLPHARLSDYEEDHMVSLGLGGNPTDPKNLWPELWTGPRGALVKDLDENRLHALVCARKITLEEGQRRLLAIWGR